MLERWQRRLVLSNIAVFLAVLSVFCATVYYFGCSAFDVQLKDKLRSIADSAISSIDFDDAGQSHNGKPDLIVSVLPDEASPALQNMRIQWFDTTGKLDIQKGNFALQVPFQKQEDFQIQQTPGALVFTKPAIANGKLLGFVRVAHPLAELEKQKNMLFQCLLLGALVAVSVSGVGVFLLVRESLKPMEEIIRHLKQFCADAAHELRNPITAIRTNSSVALRYPEGMREGDKEKFKAIASGALQIEKLTEDLLMLAKADQVLKQTEPSRTDLNEALQLVMEGAALSASKKALKFSYELDEQLNVLMDRDDMDCVLRNLIDNAVKYTPDEGIIKVCAAASNGGVRVTVSDSGIGIKTEDVSRIFERFWRADEARSHHSGGNGLGLPIVKAIVEKNGGTIAVVSEQGNGTTFKMYLRGGKSLSDGKGE